MRSFFGVALPIAIAFLSAPLAEAQEQSPANPPDYRGTIMVQLDAAAGAVGEHGFTADATAVSPDQVIGMLPAEASAMFELNLTEGVTYLITGACDEDCGDMDLAVYVDGSLVDQDIEDDDVPVLEFTAPSSGHYMLDVRMVACETNRCYFGFRVLRKS